VRKLTGLLLFGADGNNHSGMFYPNPIMSFFALLLAAAPVQTGKSSYTIEQLTGRAGFADLGSAAAGISCIARRPTQVASMNPGRTLRTEAHKKYLEMASQLCKDTGYSLRLVSDYRSAADQLKIWNGKKANIAAEAKKRGCTLAPSGAVRQQSIALCILKFNSMPGTSRHHWGTDVDFNSVSPAAWSSGTNAAIKIWLDANAPKYGFCQPYAGKASGIRKAGYNDEAWHWSYMPLASEILAQHQKLVADNDILATVGGAASGLSETDIAAMHIRRDYVGGIADKCAKWGA
jgi:zinc D-Ala-D-Ala carboxypeptidase